MSVLKQLEKRFLKQQQQQAPAPPSDLAAALDAHIEATITRRVAEELAAQRPQRYLPTYAQDFAAPAPTPAAAPLKALPSDFHLVLERGEDHRTVALTASGGGHQQRFLVQRDHYGRAIGVRPVVDAHPSVPMGEPQ